MAEGHDERKGRVLYEEKKISSRTVLVLLVLGEVGGFFFGYSMMQGTGGGLDLFLGAFFALILFITFLPFALLRHHPLVIYERGFDAPVPVHKFSEARERFVPFSDVDKVHPEVVETYWTTLPRGFTILTKEGRRIDIVEVIEPKVRAIRTHLESALGDSWGSVLVEAPYVGYDELQKLEAILSRSAWTVYAEAIGVMAFAFVFNFAAMIVYSDFGLFMMSGVVLFVAIMFGALRIASYHAARAKYKRAVSADPTLKGMFSSMGIDLAYDDPLEMAERFTDADWRRLDRSVRDKRVYVVMGTGIAVMAVSFIVRSLGQRLDLLYSLFLVLLFLGMGIMMSSLLFVRKMSKDSELLSNIVKLELKRGTRILPDWFEVKGGLGGSRVFRDPPRLTDEEWEKLVSASRVRDEKHRIVFMVPLMIMMPLALVLLLFLPVPAILGFGILMTVVMSTMVYIWTVGSRNAKLMAIEAYEEHSGEEVIPERYRKRITGGFE